MKHDEQKVSKVSVAVYIAIVLFSMSTWMDVVGVWIEMPLFVTTLPEGWSLPSYLAIIIQLANIGPAVYAIIQKFQQGSITSDEKDGRSKKVLDVEVILTLIIIITAALNIFLLSFLWSITSPIFGQDRSIVMLTQMVPTALTSCMTSLVFLPYMARFPSTYISAFYVGQGFSGLVPGLIGLIQGAGSPPQCLRNATQGMNDTIQNVTGEMGFGGVVTTASSVIIQSQEPLFSVQIFFFCLTALFLVSLVAFCCLNFSKCGRSAMLGHLSMNDVILETKQQSPYHPAASGNEKTSLNNVDILEHGVHQTLVHADNETVELTESQNEQTKSLNGRKPFEKPDNCNSHQQLEEVSAKMPKRVFIWLLIVIGVVNALSNGLLPSTESYTCLPYGYLVYTLAVRLSSVAASLASLSSMFLPRASVRVVFILTLLGLTFSVFHMILALQSPNPVLRGHLLGDIIVVSGDLYYRHFLKHVADLLPD